MRTHSLPRFVLLLAGVSLALALAGSPVGPAAGPRTVRAQTAPGVFIRRDFPLPDGHFYTQTNGRTDAATGYAITDGGDIPFWSEFQRLGGVAALGYPVTGRFVWDGFVVQATQRVVLQWRPEL